MTDRQTMDQPIRVALRIVGDPVPAFLADAAERVLRVAGVEVVLILIAKPAPGRQRRAPTNATRDRGAVRLPGAACAPRRSVRPGAPVVRSRHARDPRGARHVRRRLVTPSAKRRWTCSSTLRRQPGTAAVPIPPLGRWRLEFADGTDGPREARLTRPTAGVALARSLLSVELPSGERIETGAGIGSLHRYGFGRDRDADLLARGPAASATARSTGRGRRRAVTAAGCAVGR